MEYISAYLIPIVDILLVAYIIYVVYKSILGTRTIQVLRGVFLIICSYFVGDFLGLETFLWLYTKVLEVSVIALLIIFQNEIRRFVMRLGENIPIFKSYFQDTEAKNIKTIISALYTMASKRTGALIVITNYTKLGTIIEKGIKLDALLSKQILLSIFDYASPLHDGAVIIVDDRIAAASCFLRLTERADLDPTLGTRHRAALGLSEESDAVILVASEENGFVSLVYDRQIYYNLPEYSCEELLNRLLHDNTIDYDNNKIKNFLKKTFARQNKKSKKNSDGPKGKNKKDKVKT